MVTQYSYMTMWDFIFGGNNNESKLTDIRAIVFELKLGYLAKDYELETLIKKTTSYREVYVNSRLLNIDSRGMHATSSNNGRILYWLSIHNKGISAGTGWSIRDQITGYIDALLATRQVSLVI